MDLLDRLFDHLVRAVERERIGRSPTVGDVYQRLIPYRGVRAELGVWELAEYEHALLRMLAGERGYVSLSSEEPRQELLRELASPNPILGIYRDYSALPLEIRAPLPDAASPKGPPLAADQSAPLEDGEPAQPSAASACAACASELPRTADLRFCPACGADQRALHCGECAAVLKPEWNFCIRCGAPRLQPGAGRTGG